MAEIAPAVFRAVHGPQLKSSSSTSASTPLIPHRELISDCLEKDGLTLTKSHIKLGRMGVAVSDNALYSVPTCYVGKEVEVKGTKVLVRIYHQQQLIKTHPKKAAGQRSTDFDDYPKEKSAYAMRDVNYYISAAQNRGQKQGAFMAELLAGDVPWTYIRQAQALLRLGDKYGETRVEAACTRALAFGLMNVKRVEGIIKQSLGKELAPTPTGTRIFTLSPPRFGRVADYFSHHTTKEHENGNNLRTEAASESAAPLALA